MSGAPLLEMSAARARRGAFEIGPLSLRVEAGQCLAVVGPNGAGKSTLLALASGALEPSSGHVWLGGDAASDLAADEVARRVASPAAPTPPPVGLSVLELVLHGRWAHLSGWRFATDADVEIAREALDRLAAASLAERDIRSLSSGELQRVMLAKALAQRAPLVLLDEPAASLDIVHRSSLRRLVEAGRREGLGLVLVTHDLEVAAAACDSILLMAAGRVVAEGQPAEVLASGPLSEAFGVPIEVERTPSGAPLIRPAAP